jgi:hypothetical protein
VSDEDSATQKRPIGRKHSAGYRDGDSFGERPRRHIQAGRIKAILGARKMRGVKMKWFYGVLD